MAGNEAVIVYEGVLDELLAALRANIMHRRDNSLMPGYGEAIKAVQRRASWVAASEKDLEGSQQLTLLGSGDDVEEQAALKARMQHSLIDMAAWLVHDRIRHQYPDARTLREIEELHQREMLAEAEKARKQREQSELFDEDAAKTLRV